jgi:hypothetical protein
MRVRDLLLNSRLFKRSAGSFSPAAFRGILSPMPSRRKKSKFKVAKEAKRRARLGIGLPPPERVIVEKRHKPAKHKQTLSELLADESK